MFVDWLNPQPGWRVLDVAGGTGDIAFRVAAKVKKRGGRADIVVADINYDDAEGGHRAARGKARAASPGCVPTANACPSPTPAATPSPSPSASATSPISSACWPRPIACCKPGGRFLCLEFSRVVAPGLDDLYDAYSFAVLPRLGEMVAGDGDAYRYLAESIRRFPAQAPFARMIAAAGFANVKVRNLSAGIAAMHSGWKI